MFRFLYCLIASFLFCSLCFAQEDPKSPPTNFDEFVAKQSGFIQIEDFPLTRMILELSYGETRIRKVSTDGQIKLYYQVQSGPYLGSVAYEDYPALMKAYAALQEQSLQEKKNTRDFYINKYVDRGGLEIGYQVERKKLTWFMKPHKLGPRTLFLKDPATMEESLAQAGVKLEQIR